MTRAYALESIQTREARDRAREAEEVYARHVKFCATCKPRHRPPQFCADGQGYSAMRSLMREQLEHERAEDRKPYPGQRSLFDD